MGADRAASWVLSPSAEAPAHARALLRRYAESRGTVAHTGAWDTAELLLSELVTNAFQHGRGPVEVRVYDDRRRFRIEVIDMGSRRPEVQALDLSATHGRGLLLVETLASAWGVHWMPAAGREPGPSGGRTRRRHGGR